MLNVLVVPVLLAVLMVLALPAALVVLALPAALAVLALPAALAVLALPLLLVVLALPLLLVVLVVLAVPVLLTVRFSYRRLVETHVVLRCFRWCSPRLLRLMLLVVLAPLLFVHCLFPGPRIRHHRIVLIAGFF